MLPTVKYVSVIIISTLSGLAQLHLFRGFYNSPHNEFLYRYTEPPTNTDSSVFIRILKLITDEKPKNTDD